MQAVAIPVHYDGDLAWTGVHLLANFNSPESVNDLLEARVPFFNSISTQTDLQEQESRYSSLPDDDPQLRRRYEARMTIGVVDSGELWDAILNATDPGVGECVYFFNGSRWELNEGPKDRLMGDEWREDFDDDVDDSDFEREPDGTILWHDLADFVHEQRIVPVSENVDLSAVTLTTGERPNMPKRTGGLEL